MNTYNQQIVRSPVILFLGAGASADLGKPIMTEFIEKLEKSLTGEVAELVACIKRERGNDLELILEDLQELQRLDYVSGFEMKTLDADKMMARNSEEFVARHTIRNPDASIFKPRSFGQSVVAEALRRVRKAIIEEYGTVPDKRLKPLYDPLFGTIIKALGREVVLPIFTTNYDQAIEKFCDQTHWRRVNGFAPRSSGSHDFVWKRSVFDEFAPEGSMPNIVLFKLHGSVDWARDPQTNEVRYSLPIHLADQPFQNSVIYPAMRKVAIDEPYSTAYEYFQRCCERTDLCIVIGYSFRDYDALTRLRSAARFNSEFRVMLVSPEPHVLTERLAGINIDPVMGYFNREHHGYLSEIESAVSKAKDAAGIRAPKTRFI